MHFAFCRILWCLRFTNLNLFVHFSLFFLCFIYINHDFIKQYNGNANCNDEIEIHNDSPYLNYDTFCMYYTPDEVAQKIGNENNQLSILYLNCRSINANWDSLNQLIYNVTSEHCRFDFICLR